MSTKHPTINTIAASTGLSRTTVSHILGGRAEKYRICTETQKRVLEAAHSLGYRPNASARAVRGGRYGSIALVQSLYRSYFPQEMLLGLSTAIADKNLHLVVSQGPDELFDDESYLTHAMTNLAVDGVLVNRHFGYSKFFVTRLHQLHIPAVFLNVRQEYDCVHPDEVMGGRMAAKHLLDMGHERIAYINPDVEMLHFSGYDRRSGYEQAMADAGKAPWTHAIPGDWEALGEAGFDRRVYSAQTLLDRPDRPTAIVAYEMGEAMAVIRAALILGLRIPQDLSVVVFHSRLDDTSFIPIDTVSNVMEKVGSEAVNMLLRKIKEPEKPLPALSIPSKFLIGATCMPPATKGKC